jgi:hypothetical protein
LTEESNLQGILDSPLTGQKLARLKTRALRKRVWFRALDRVERGLLDLTIRWVDDVRSGRLTETLVQILLKLARAMEQGVARVLVAGRELALRASALAVEWGNEPAYAWRFDREFWLGITREFRTLD